ncbi:hypothetical protein CXB51_009508 [Gossypium anomalum]|uniref:Uncharacterized protein n=1 Tax=Gossypium anomalum TaxID=47600 RepID=A0A8J5Z7E5_9ROSI|nr:hypothetical protein CXB51_009508 [Gossypium anomalum]
MSMGPSTSVILGQVRRLDERLTSKWHMKIMLRWMRERQQVRLICNHVGPHKQFMYTLGSLHQPHKSCP